MHKADCSLTFQTEVIVIFANLRRFVDYLKYLWLNYVLFATDVMSKSNNHGSGVSEGHI